jgi:hypothetical protein
VYWMPRRVILLKDPHGKPGVNLLYKWIDARGYRDAWDHTVRFKEQLRQDALTKVELGVAGCHGGAGGCPYEGQVPHTGRARTQEFAPVSKVVGFLVMRVTHQPLKSRLNAVALQNM